MGEIWRWGKKVGVRKKKRVIRRRGNKVVGVGV
jgi:hypothetical protein